MINNKSISDTNNNKYCNPVYGIGFETQIIENLLNEINRLKKELNNILQPKDMVFCTTVMLFMLTLVNFFHLYSLKYKIF